MDEYTRIYQKEKEDHRAELLEFEDRERFINEIRDI